MDSACAVLSVFIREPEFQGQTKDKLSSPDAQRLVENVMRDHFDHWLAEAPAEADKLLDFVIDSAEDRLKKRRKRKSRARPPPASCACPASWPIAPATPRKAPKSSWWKATRRWKRQAGARPKHPGNPAFARQDSECRQRRRRQDAAEPGIDRSGAGAGCGLGSKYRDEDLRYERVIVMTDADVDGAHIASLLLTFFYREMPELIAKGHLFLAMPPLYRMTQGPKTVYARDDADRERLLKTEFRGNARVEVSRFKGLGEMMPQQLKETTMKAGLRT